MLILGKTILREDFDVYQWNSSRQRVREKFHGLSYLFEIINQIMLSRSEPIAAADSGLKSMKKQKPSFSMFRKSFFSLQVSHCPMRISII